MKNILLVLFVAVLATSCKKDNIYNCLEGKWDGNIGQIGDGFTISNGSITYSNGSSMITVNIDKNGYMTYNNNKIGVADCNGNTLIITYTGQNPIICTKSN